MNPETRIEYLREKIAEMEAEIESLGAEKPDNGRCECGQVHGDDPARWSRRVVQDEDSP